MFFLLRPSTPRGIQTADLTSLPSEATTGLAQTPFPRTKFPSIPIPLSHLHPIRTPFESLLHKKYLDKLSRVAVTYTVNIAFHPAPSSRSGNRPLPAPLIPPRPRILHARRLPRSGQGVGVYPERLGAFSSPLPKLISEPISGSHHPQSRTDALIALLRRDRSACRPQTRRKPLRFLSLLREQKESNSR